MFFIGGESCLGADATIQVVAGFVFALYVDLGHPSFRLRHIRPLKQTDTASTKTKFAMADPTTAEQPQDPLV